MATLVLTVAGGAVGGPVGAMIGAAIGQQADAAIFAPRPREGPRLTELAVQTSSYGTPIPRLFGMMRVAGTVIWATELSERRSSGSGGKGRPATVSYSYSASFAVLLSARRVRAVKRIWADGKLLRGQAGDWKTRTGFRLHNGDQDQAVDPLIASALGASRANAYRGYAYVVFENLELADFGNRIPSLTFEVEADAGPVAIGDILADCTDGAIVRSAGRHIAGYAASGDSMGGVVVQLAEMAGGWIAEDGGALRLVDPDEPLIPIRDRQATREGHVRSSGGRAIAGVDAIAATIAVRHYDPARDYQAGVQRARMGGSGTRETIIDVPAALDAGMARSLAVQSVERADVERERRTLTLEWDALAVTPGAHVRIEGEEGSWRIDHWRLEHMVLTLDLIRTTGMHARAPIAGGAFLPAPDRMVGETRLALFELPPTDGVTSSPLVYAAMGGTGTAWRQAELLVGNDNNGLVSATTQAYPATIGRVDTPPGEAVATLADRKNHIEVTLANVDAVLTWADRAALDQGANLALVGNELIQFGRADPLGEGRWRLSELWRGRRGTEFAIAEHFGAEQFVLLEREAMSRIELAGLSIGTALTALASGLQDDAPATASLTVSGWALAPPSPVHVRTAVIDDTLVVRWTRRSRLGWLWQDRLDAPLAEESERYRATLTSPEGRQTVDVAAPMATFELPAGPATFTVVQIGTSNVSGEAVLHI